MAHEDPDEGFSVAEEVANSLTHGAGLLLGVTALVLMVVFAVQRGSAVHVVACTLYGATLVLLYSASTFYHALPHGRARRLQLILYLVMGWSIVIVARPLVQGLARGGIVLLLVGGLAYTLGVVFFVWRSLPFHHAAWHVFVLGGSVCHFFSVLLYVIP